MILPELAGVNWDGEPFRSSDLEGRVAVLFFGYTYCPDVCPLTLAKMKRLYAELGESAGSVAVVFVTIDPERDSRAKLADYVPGFDRRFFGVRLDDESLSRAVQKLGIVVEKGPAKPQLGYLVDHTADFFVVDPQGKLRVKHSVRAAPEDLRADIERLLAA